MVLIFLYGSPYGTGSMIDFGNAEWYCGVVLVTYGMVLIVVTDWLCIFFLSLDDGNVLKKLGYSYYNTFVKICLGKDVVVMLYGRCGGFKAIVWCVRLGVRLIQIAKRVYNSSEVQMFGRFR